MERVKLESLVCYIRSSLRCLKDSLPERSRDGGLFESGAWENFNLDKTEIEVLCMVMEKCEQL